jgi:hypothetical protein
MADPDPRSADGVPLNSEGAPAGAEPRPAGPGEGNHAPPQAAHSAPDDRSGLDRAEEVVDYLAERVSSLTSIWGRKLLRLGSRARESAEDFWAEVQDFRQGKKP